MICRQTGTTNHEGELTPQVSAYPSGAEGPRQEEMADLTLAHDGSTSKRLAKVEPVRAMLMPCVAMHSSSRLTAAAVLLSMLD